MAQMEGEQKQAENIETRHKIILETVNYHRINVVMAERIRLEQRKARVGFTESEMRQMIKDEGEHNQPAHHHVARGERGFHMLSVDIRLGSSAPILDRQLNRYI